MRTTIDLPDGLLQRAKIAAVNRRTTVRALVEKGLLAVLDEVPGTDRTGEALERLRAGYHLGGKPMSRDQVHDR